MTLRASTLRRNPRRFVYSTPYTCPPTVRILSTLVWNHISTPLSRHQYTSASAMSHAFPLLGNTRSPCSTASLTPIRSKNLNTALLLKLRSAGRKNSTSPRIFARHSSSDRMFVTLQRPLPDMRTLRPPFSIFSISRTLYPFFAARPAAISPAAPPPMTATS